MTRLMLFGLATLILIVGWREGARLDRLEKQNNALKGQIAQRDAANNLDIQGKCANTSRAWFNDAFSRDKDTILLHYTNHYNKAQNKCFILVEWHYKTNYGPGSWTNHMSMWDVYENAKYGEFAEQHISSVRPTYSQDFIEPCEVSGSTCKTAEEFNDLVRPYLNN